MLVSSSKPTLCHFPDEEIEEQSQLFLLRTCLRQTTCSPLDLFFYLWEPFQTEAASYFMVNIWVRPTHWEFQVGEMKAKMPPVEVHCLSLPPTHRLMQLQQFQGVNRPWGTTFKLSVLHAPERSMSAEAYNPSHSFRQQLQEMLGNLQAQKCEPVLKGCVLGGLWNEC